MRSQSGNFLGAGCTARGTTTRGTTTTIITNTNTNSLGRLDCVGVGGGVPKAPLRIPAPAGWQCLSSAFWVHAAKRRCRTGLDPEIEFFPSSLGPVLFDGVDRLRRGRQLLATQLHLHCLLHCQLRRGDFFSRRLLPGTGSSVGGRDWISNDQHETHGCCH